MTGAVLLAVLGSAAMHGTWNALAKLIPHRLVSSALIGVAYLVIGGIGCLLLPLPDRESVPALLVSVGLQTAYLILLTAAYSVSDFGTVYPVTRGIAVLGVTLVSVTLLGEVLSSRQLVAVLVIVAALAALALRSAAGSSTTGSSRLGLLLALGVGSIVAGYSLVDGVGVRSSGSVLGYASWMFLLQGVTIPLACLLLSRDRGELLQGMRRHAPMGLLGGALSLLSYGIVVWAQSQAPLALVSALRETGVIAAVFVGRWVFGERLTAVGIGASILAAGGIVLLRLGS